jgi:hypothetical protein
VSGRDVTLGEFRMKSEWIDACEAAEDEAIAEGNEPDDATLYLVESYDEMPDEICLGLDRLRGYEGADVSTDDIDVIDGTGEPRYLLGARVRCVRVRRALGVPRFDYDRQCYVALPKYVIVAVPRLRRRDGAATDSRSERQPLSLPRSERTTDVAECPDER